MTTAAAPREEFDHQQLPGKPTVLGQSIGLLIDGYRELNARRLFWVTMVLNGIVVGVFGAVGVNERGFTVFGKTILSPVLNTSVIDAQQLYKFIFANFGINIWLTWVAMILALLSTAGTFPDLMSGGSIELYISKPIGRLRLFLTRYMTGMMFVALQVVVFCAASFVVIGLRGGVWEAGIFLAVPLVMLVFSYLFGICVLMGVWTRSSTAALLLTAAAWFGTFMIHNAEFTTLQMSMAGEVRLDRIEQLKTEITLTQQQLDAALAATQPAGKSGATTAPAPIPAESQMQAPARSSALLALPAWARVLYSANNHPSASALQMRLRVLDSSLEAEQAPMQQQLNWAYWHKIVYRVYWLLPKTGDTDDLIQRWLAVAARLPRPRNETLADSPMPGRNRSFATRGDFWLANDRATEELAQRSGGWVIGTSLLFEAVVLSLAAWSFCRRDY